MMMLLLLLLIDGWMDLGRDGESVVAAYI